MEKSETSAKAATVVGLTATFANSFVTVPVLLVPPEFEWR